MLAMFPVVFSLLTIIAVGFPRRTACRRLEMSWPPENGPKPPDSKQNGKKNRKKYEHMESYGSV